MGGISTCSLYVYYKCVLCDGQKNHAALLQEKDDVNYGERQLGL